MFQWLPGLIMLIICNLPFFCGAEETKAVTPDESDASLEEEKNDLFYDPSVKKKWFDLDYLHDTLHMKLQSKTEQVDYFLAGDLVEKEAVPDSRFRLGIHAETRVDRGLSIRFDPEFDADVSLPNTEKRWNIFVTGQDMDELPGTNPSERDKGFYAGIKKKGLKKLPVNLSVGIHFSWLPSAFIKTNWKRLYEVGVWYVIPEQRAYYKTDDGLGEVTSLNVYRWFGGNQCGYIRSTSAGRWTEESFGWEWEQLLTLGYVDKLIEEKESRGIVHGDDVAEGYGIRGGVFGHKSGSGVVDLYRITLMHRRPIYKEWMYLVSAVEVQWDNEYDWDEEYRLRVGLDMLFWGSRDR